MGFAFKVCFRHTVCVCDTDSPFLYLEAARIWNSRYQLDILPLNLAGFWNKLLRTFDCRWLLECSFSHVSKRRVRIIEPWLTVEESGNEREASGLFLFKCKLICSKAFAYSSTSFLFGWTTTTITTRYRLRQHLLWVNLFCTHLDTWLLAWIRNKE